MRSTEPNRGFIMVAALIALVVALGIGFGLVRSAALEAQQERLIEQRLQAQWLVESGLERAASKLASERDYEGEETWLVSPEQLGRRDGGSVLIRFSKISDRPTGRTIFVQADFPSGIPERARKSKEIIVDLP